MPQEAPDFVHSLAPDRGLSSTAREGSPRSGPGGTRGARVPLPRLALSPTQSKWSLMGRTASLDTAGWWRVSAMRPVHEYTREGFPLGACTNILSPSRASTTALADHWLLSGASCPPLWPQWEPSPQAAPLITPSPCREQTGQKASDGIPVAVRNKDWVMVHGVSVNVAPSSQNCKCSCSDVLVPDAPGESPLPAPLFSQGLLCHPHYLGTAIRSLLLPPSSTRPLLQPGTLEPTAIIFEPVALKL